MNSNTRSQGRDLIPVAIKCNYLGMLCFDDSIFCESGEHGFIHSFILFDVPAIFHF